MFYIEAQSELVNGGTLWVFQICDLTVEYIDKTITEPKKYTYVGRFGPDDMQAFLKMEYFDRGELVEYHLPYDDKNYPMLHTGMCIVAKSKQSLFLKLKSTIDDYKDNPKQKLLNLYFDYYRNANPEWFI